MASGATPGGGEDAARYDELAAKLAANRADIDALLSGAEAASSRADAAESDADLQRVRIDDLEARGVVDRAMIEELRTDGILIREQAVNLQAALRSARTIGAALGIVMAVREVDEEEAFELLREVSQRTNQKVRVLAEGIVLTRDVSQFRRP